MTGPCSKQTSRRESRQMRQRVYRRLLERGWKLKEIGGVFGISKQGVHQVVGNTLRKRSTETVELQGRIIARLWSWRWPMWKIASIWGMPATTAYQTVRREKRF